MYIYEYTISLSTFNIRCDWINRNADNHGNKDDNRDMENTPDFYLFRYSIFVIMHEQKLKAQLKNWMRETFMALTSIGVSFNWIFIMRDDKIVCTQRESMCEKERQTVCSMYIKINLHIEHFLIVLISGFFFLSGVRRKFICCIAKCICMQLQW